jgi:hypothetical protein
MCIMNEYASSALLIRLAPDSGFSFMEVKGMLRLDRQKQLRRQSTQESIDYLSSGGDCQALRAVFARPAELQSNLDRLRRGLLTKRPLSRAFLHACSMSAKAFACEVGSISYGPSSSSFAGDLADSFAAGSASHPSSANAARIAACVSFCRAPNRACGKSFRTACHHGSS